MGPIKFNTEFSLISDRNFEVLSDGTYWRGALKRRRGLFQSKRNFSHENFKTAIFSLQITMNNYYYIPFTLTFN